MKWRAYSPATARIAELVGAQPVTVQAAELSQAMATGVIESYMSSGSTGYDTKTYEHIKYWYDTQAWLPKNAVLVNKAAFDALDKPTQAGAAEGRRRRRGARLGAVARRRTPSTLDLLKKNGMNIVPPSPQLKADMKKVGDTMLKEWLEKAGPEGKALVDAYKQVKQRRRAPLLDALYDGAAALAALFMVGLLVMVLLSILGRQLHFHVPGTDAYAGYMMAAAGFLALAHTLKRGEHIRVTLLLSRAARRRAARRWSCGRWPRPSLLAALSAFYSCALAWQSHALQRHLHRQRRHAAVDSAAGDGASARVVLAIAFVDELVLELRGQRASQRRACTTRPLHNE